MDIFDHSKIFIKNIIHFLSCKSVRINMFLNGEFCLDHTSDSLMRSPYRPALHGIVSIELPDHTNRFTALELPFLSNITFSLTRGISTVAPG